MKDLNISKELKKILNDSQTSIESIFIENSITISVAKYHIIV